MAVELSVDHDKRLCVVTVRGPTHVREILDCYDQFNIQAVMSYAKLWDVSEAELFLGNEEIMTMAAYTSAYATFDPRGPIAIVAITDHGRSQMRHYIGLTRQSRAIRLFSSKASAEKWLASQPLPSPLPAGRSGAAT